MEELEGMARSNLQSPEFCIAQFTEPFLDQLEIACSQDFQFLRRHWNDTPDRSAQEGSTWRGEEEPTLQALEGLPALDRGETRGQQNGRDGDSSNDEDGDGEITYATLISSDVKATEAVESTLGTWLYPMSLLN